MDRDELLDRVFVELRRDIELGDYTAIEELLSAVPDAILEAYLPEEM
jgi:hypothetical protein